MLPRNILILAATGILAACNSGPDETGEETQAVTTPLPQLTSTPTPMAADDGTPLAAGAWSISESVNGAEARFGAADAKPLLLMACARDTGRLTMSIDNDTTGGMSFILEAGGAAARLDTVSNESLSSPYQVADIQPDAPIFDGFVQTGGVIQVTYPGGNVLRVPSAPGIRRIFDACS